MKTIYDLQIYEKTTISRVNLSDADACMLKVLGFYKNNEIRCVYNKSFIICEVLGIRYGINELIAKNIDVI